MSIEKPLATWLTEKAVAFQTGISLSTLRKHRHMMKGIPYSKIGRSVRYNEADVLAFMESKKVNLTGGKKNG